MEILCFGSADFENRSWVNAQHLMWRLARENRVLYVNSLGLRAPRASGRDLRRVGRRIAGLWRRPYRPSPDRELHVLSPCTLPLARGPRTRSLAATMLAAQLRRAMRDLQFTRPLAWVFLPSAYDVLGRLSLRAIIYHCVDAYEANPGVDAALVRSLEDALLERAGIVLATSAPLCERLGARHPDTRYLPNVVDTVRYPPPGQPPAEPPDLAAVPHPRVGYLGNLAAYKCDLELLAEAARARPDFSWVFIGASGLGEAGSPAAGLGRHASVHLLGEKSGAELPAYLHHLDVGLIPFRHSPSTRFSFPMKFFEYLACGLPVVSARLDGLAPHLTPPLAFAYDSAAEFLPKIDEALASRDRATADARRRMAEAHSWERRMVEIGALLTEIDRPTGADRGGRCTGGRDHSVDTSV